MSSKKIIDKFKLIILNNQIIKKLVTQKNYLNNQFKTKYCETTTSNLLAKLRVKLFDKIFFRFINKNYNNNKNKSKFIFTSYCTATFYQKFSWDDYRITNDELEDYVTEILTEFGHNGQRVALNEPIPDNNEININTENKWENVFKRSDLVIWRRKLIEKDEVVEDVSLKEKQPSIYEYKVFGRLFDISPIDFFRTQIDLEYRKTWDHLVVKLEIMSVDKKVENQTSELIQWIMKFPFPMNSRQYIFVRRYCVDPNKGLLVLLSKSIPNSNVVFVNEEDEDEDTESIISHNKGKEKNEIKNEEISTTTKKKTQYEQPHKQAPYVRVTKFQSNMIIVSHCQDFHSPGLDFYLTYYDDPKAQIPKMAMSWMATSGLPDWLNKLHKAAKRVPKPVERINITDDYEVVLIKEKKENIELQNPSVNQESEIQIISSPIEASVSNEEDKLEKSNDILIDPSIDPTIKDDGISNIQIESTLIEENITPNIIDKINETQIETKVNIKENNIPQETSINTNSSLNSLNSTEEEVVLITNAADIQSTPEIPEIQIENPIQDVAEEINDKQKKEKIFFRQFDNEPDTSLLF
jgi:StAR-related lipid transfer protein 7, mitochondrial